MEERNRFVKKNTRIDVADVLRGFAVMGIIILHSVEHFNFYRYPPDVPFEWMKFTDKAVWDGLFFTFGGKAYAIFALLFGFSFFIQDDNESRRGGDFRLRFLWRLVLLFLLGQLNAAFFTAEILTMYAMVGIVLPLCCRMNNKLLITVIIICLLQPLDLANVVYALFNPDYVAAAADGGIKYWEAAFKAQSEASFIEMVKVNLYEGQLASLTWAWEHGRIFQTAGLFLAGLWVGRRKLFVNTGNHETCWLRFLLFGLLLFFPLKGLHDMMPDYISRPELLQPLQRILQSLANFGFMTAMVTGIILVYYRSRNTSWFMWLAPYGKMSLTNYLTQSMIGSLFFYHWGVYLHIGITYSFLFGIALFMVQLTFCTVWMKYFSHGPFEGLWKRLTWIGVKRRQ